MDWTQIILSAIPVVLGIGIVWAKAEKALVALKEVADILTTISAALADKTLTEEELAKIKKEAGEAVAALKAIIK